MNSILQDPESVGAGLKVISMRLRGTSTEELEAAGEDSDGLIKTVSKLDETIRKLTAINGKRGISLLDENGNYKDTYTFLQQLADSWEDIAKADKQDGQNRQAAILEAIAGKNRSQVAASILQNPDMLRDVYVDSQNSTDSAKKENETYMSSIEAHEQVIHDKWVAIWSDAITKNQINWVLDRMSDLLGLVQQIGIGPGVAGIGSFAMFLKGSMVDGKGAFTTTKNGENKWVSDFNTDSFAGQFLSQGKISKSQNSYISKVYDQYHNIFVNNEGNQEAINQSLEDFATKLEGTDKPMAEMIRNFGQAEVAGEKFKDQAKALTKEINGTGLGMATFATTIKNVLVNLAQAGIMAGITYGVTKLIEVIGYGINAEKELVASAQDFSSKINSSSQDIDKYQEKINDLAKIINDSSSSYEQVQDAREQVLSIQQEMIGTYGDEQLVIDSVTDAVNGQADAFDRLKQSQYEAQLGEFNKKSGLQKAWEVFEWPAQAINYYGGFINDKPDLQKTKLEQLREDANDWQREGSHSFSVSLTDEQFKQIQQFIPEYQGVTATKKNNGTYKFDFEGSNRQIYNALSSIGNYTQGISSDFQEQLGTMKSDVYNEMSQSQSALMLSTLYSKIMPDTLGYKQDYNTLSEIEKEYEKALSEGDQTKIDNASGKYYNQMVSVVDNARKNGDNDVAEYFLKYMNENSTNILSNYQFKQLFKANAGGLQDIIQDILNSPELKNYSLDEIKRLANTGNTGYNQLAQLAQNNGFASTNAMLDALKTLNVGHMDADTTLMRILGTSAESDLSQLNEKQLDAIRKHTNIAYDFEITKSTMTPGASNVDILKKLADSASTSTIKKDVSDISSEIDDFTTNMADLNTAVEQQNKNSSISASTYNTLNKALQGIGVETKNLGEYYTVTANGIELNTAKVKELMATKQSEYLDKVNKAYEDANKIYNQDMVAIEQYNNMLTQNTDLTDDQRKAIQEAIKTRQADADAIDEQRRQLILYNSELNDLDKTFNSFQAALQTPDAGANYTAMHGSLEQMRKEAKQGLYGTDQMVEFIKYWTGQDTTDMSRDDTKKLWEEANKKAKRYSTEDATGINNMAKDIYNIGKSSKDVNNAIESLPDGTVKINDMHEAAKLLGMDVAALYDTLKRMKDYKINIDFDVDEANLEVAKENFEEIDKKRDLWMANNKGKEIPAELQQAWQQAKDQLDLIRTETNVPVNFDINYDGLQKAMDELQKYLNEHHITNIEADPTAVNYQKTIYDYMDKLGLDHGYLDSNNENGTWSVGLNFDVDKSDADSFMSETDEFSKTEHPVLFDFSEAYIGLHDFENEINRICATRTVTFEYAETDENGNHHTFGQTVGTLDASAKTNANPTPGHSRGDAGKSGSWQGQNNAFVNGQNNENLISNADGKTLVGELGPEARVNVHTGQWDILGQNGPELRTDIHSDDIIFNHKQTQGLLSNGHIDTKGNAHASGLNNMGDAFGLGSFLKKWFTQAEQDERMRRWHAPINQWNVAVNPYTPKHGGENPKIDIRKYADKANAFIKSKAQSFINNFKDNSLPTESQLRWNKPTSQWSDKKLVAEVTDIDPNVESKILDKVKKANSIQITSEHGQTTKPSTVYIVDGSQNLLDVSDPYASWSEPKSKWSITDDVSDPYAEWSEPKGKKKKSSGKSKTKVGNNTITKDGIVTTTVSDNPIATTTTTTPSTTSDWTTTTLGTYILDPDTFMNNLINGTVMFSATLDPSAGLNQNIVSSLTDEANENAWEYTSNMTDDQMSQWIANKKYGNIDMSNRQVVENDDGSYSTVEGSDSTFGNYEVAFSPIVQGNDNNPTFLDDDTINWYFNRLSDMAKDPDDFLALDHKGLVTTDGLKIHDMVSYVASSDDENGKMLARIVSEITHYVGEYYDQAGLNPYYNLYKSNKAFVGGQNNSLVGELGPEIRVRGSHWDLLGTNGAEFTDVRPNDIVFNAQQTQDLLATGHTNTRGTAFANGNAFVGGDAHLNSTAEFNVHETSSVAEDVKKATKALDKNTKATKDNTDSQEKKEFNWADQAMKIEKLNREWIADKADNSYSSYADRKSNYEELIEYDKKMIADTNKYYATKQNDWDEKQNNLLKYMSTDQAKDVLTKIQQGDLTKENYKDTFKLEPKQNGETDEAYNKRKKAYDDQNTAIQEAVSAFDDLINAINDTKDAQKQLLEDQKKAYELDIAHIEHTIDDFSTKMDTIQTNISIKQTTGRIVTAGDYNSLIEASQGKQAGYEQEIARMEERLGELDEDSDEYWSVLSSINQAKQAINQCAQEQAEWNEKILDLPIDHIKAYIENLKTAETKLADYVAELQAAGKSVTSDLLKQGIDLQQKLAEQYTTEIGLVQEKLARYEAGSDQWNDAFQSLQALSSAISEVNQKLIDYNKQLVALPVDKLNEMADTIKNIKDGLDAVQNDNLSIINTAISIIKKNAEDLTKPLQDQLDILQRQNAARQDELSIEQARWALERAREQKSVQIVRNGRLVYSADEDNVRDAQNQLNEAEANKKQNDIQRQIDKINKDAEDQSEKWEKIQTDSEYNIDVENAAKLANMTPEEFEKRIKERDDQALYEQTKKSYDETAEQQNNVSKMTEDLDTIVALLSQINELYIKGTITSDQAKSMYDNVMKRAEGGLNGQEQYQSRLEIERKDSPAKALEDATKAITDTKGSLDANYKIADENQKVIDKYQGTYEDLTKSIADLVKVATEAYKNTQDAEDVAINTGSHGSGVYKGAYSASGAPKAAQVNGGSGYKLAGTYVDEAGVTWNTYNPSGKNASHNNSYSVSNNADGTHSLLVHYANGQTVDYGNIVTNRYKSNGDGTHTMVHNEYVSKYGGDTIPGKGTHVYNSKIGPGLSTGGTYTYVADSSGSSGSSGYYGGGGSSGGGMSQAERDFASNFSNFEQLAKSGQYGNKSAEQLQREYISSHGGSSSSSNSSSSSRSSSSSSSRSSGSGSGYASNGDKIVTKKYKHYKQGIENGAVQDFSTNTFDNERVKLLQELSTMKLEPGEVPAVLHEGEVVLNSAQQAKLLNNVSQMPSIPNDAVSNATTYNTPIDIKMGNIELHEVQNVDQLADAITQQFAPAMTQSFSKIFKK